MRSKNNRGMNINAAPATTTGRSKRQLRRKRSKNINVITATAARAPRDMVRNTANAITPVPAKKSTRRDQVRLESTPPKESDKGSKRAPAKKVGADRVDPSASETRPIASPLWKHT